MGGQREMHIGEVAEAVGLPLRTVRLLDEAQIVSPSQRTADGSGVYTEADVERLRLTKRLEPLDLSVEEVAEVIEATEELADDRTTPERRRQLVERLSQVAALGEERAAHLRDQLSATEAITADLRRVVLRAGKEPSSHH